MSEQLTTDEARRLVKLAKHSLIDIIYLPKGRENIDFDVSSDSGKDIFSINIFRGKINNKKYNYGARIKKNGIILLELHINPGNIHTNPNGEKIVGSHWHYYTQEDGLRNAFSIVNLQSDDFVDTTILFLERFNVVTRPTIYHQAELL